VEVSLITREVTLPIEGNLTPKTNPEEVVSMVLKGTNEVLEEEVAVASAVLIEVVIRMVIKTIITNGVPTGATTDTVALGVGMIGTEYQQRLMPQHHDLFLWCIGF
jgi:hypothetical protein